MMRLNNLARGALNRFKKITIILIILLVGAAMYAQDTSSGNGAGKFRQHLEWNADSNAFEYKVEVRRDSKIIQSFNTEDNFADLHLPAGNYEYRVSVYDFLGRVQDVSRWQKLEIAKAGVPVFGKMEGLAELELENVTSKTTVTLVNVVTGEVIEGSIVMSGGIMGKSETGKAGVEFSEIPDGDWKLVVKNPSGLMAESPVITIKAPVVEEPEIEPEEPEQPVEPESPEVEPVETTEDVEESEPEEKKPHKNLGFSVKAGAGLELSLFNDDILSTKNYDRIFKKDGLQKFNLAPYAAVSYIHDFNWFINPGLEISANIFNFEHRTDPFGSFDYEYRQNFLFTNIQASLVGQYPLIYDKLYANLKLGGGVSIIRLKTDFAGERDQTERSFSYPKLNAGLSIEFVPLKFLVIEAGADYNHILSSKVKVMYLMPYVLVGVRF